VRRRGRFSNFGAGLLALVVIVIACYLGFFKSIPFRSHYEVKAAFTSASGIKKSSPVRIAGVEVGRVTKVEPMTKGQPAALVTMRIKKEGRPIHSDAKAKIRPRIFLEGNFFVDVSPGTPKAPELDDGQVIPINHTAIPVQLDQVLKALPADTRTNLRGALAELFRTYSDGGGAEFNRSLEFQPDAYRFSGIVSEAFLGRNPRDLSNFIRHLGGVSQGLNRNPRQLQSLVTDFNRTVGALAAEQGALQATIRELPRTLRSATPAFNALNAAFPDVRRLSRDALPGIRSTVPTLNALQPLVVQLRGLVGPDELQGLSADLRAATPPLTRFARQSVPLLGQLRAFASCANEVVIPAGNETVDDKNFPATGPAHQEFFKVLVGLSGESRSSDANGQFFKTLGTGGLDTVSLGNGLFGATASPIRGTNPPKAVRRPPLRGDVPCETQQPPDLRTKPGGPPPSVNTQPNSKAALARTAKAQTVAVDLMQAQLDRTLGAKAPQVLDQAATSGQISRLTKGIVK